VKASARQRLPAGQVCGDYRIESVLGEGVSGVVYVAEGASGQRGRVALKVIHRHLVNDRQINRRFHREASILKQLYCPNLVRLLDFGELDDGVLFMALELCEGRSLADLVENAPIDPVRAVAIVKQICNALEAAHASSIVHRDLKPSNVIVQQVSDTEERARVLDFGMAKVLRGDPMDSLNLLTEQNMVFGTPEYMAPEQARGDEVDRRCDVYATGVILYEMLTGTTPFRAATPVAVMTAHLSDPPAPPSQQAPALRLLPALEAVVLHALAKNPRQRYASARALSDALDQALAAPSDVAAVAPPPDDLATRDTERFVDVAAARRERSALENTGAAPALERVEPGRRVWLIVAILGALLGITLGIAASVARC
jgi:eukaryotic-like serine/threonine-protein kinase